MILATQKHQSLQTASRLILFTETTLIVIHKATELKATLGLMSSLLLVNVNHTPHRASRLTSTIAWWKRPSFVVPISDQVADATLYWRT